MAYLVDSPIIQNLGMQGEHLHVKVTFPVYGVDTDPLPALAEQLKKVAAVRTVILKMRAEDLPLLCQSDPALHFDVGKVVRERFSPSYASLPEKT